MNIKNCCKVGVRYPSKNVAMISMTDTIAELYLRTWTDKLRGVIVRRGCVTQIRSQPSVSVGLEICQNGAFELDAHLRCFLSDRQSEEKWKDRFAAGL